jgi:hypothetical protein
LGVTGKTEGQGLSIIPDTMYSDVYYVYHKAGVHAVSIGGWIDSLKDIKLKMEFEDGNGDLAFKNWPSKSIPSEVVCVVDSAPLPNRYVKSKATLERIFFKPNLILFKALFPLLECYQ